MIAPPNGIQRKETDPTPEPTNLTASEASVPTPGSSARSIQFTLPAIQLPLPPLQLGCPSPQLLTLLLYSSLLQSSLLGLAPLQSSSRVGWDTMPDDRPLESIERRPGRVMTGKAAVNLLTTLNHRLGCIVRLEGPRPWSPRLRAKRPVYEHYKHVGRKEHQVEGQRNQPDSKQCSPDRHRPIDMTVLRRWRRALKPDHAVPNVAGALMHKVPVARKEVAAMKGTADTSDQEDRDNEALPHLR